MLATSAVRVRLAGRFNCMISYHEHFVGALLKSQRKMTVGRGIFKRNLEQKFYSTTLHTGTQPIKTVHDVRVEQKVLRMRHRVRSKPQHGVKITYSSLVGDLLSDTNSTGTTVTNPVDNVKYFIVNDGLPLLQRVLAGFIGPLVSTSDTTQSTLPTTWPILSESTMWLCVTHKSFDQGKQGFNDRLAYLGKQMVQLQATLAYLAMPSDGLSYTDSFGRNVYQHADIDGLCNLASSQRSSLLSPDNLASLAQMYDLPRVIRWIPRNPLDLKASGSDAVYALSVYAIMGGLALERGAYLANQVIRERILQRLGI